MNDRERQLNEDYDWCLQDPEIRRAYGGKVVAVHQHKVLGVGEDHLAALEAALSDTACPSRDQLAIVVVPESLQRVEV